MDRQKCDPLLLPFAADVLARLDPGQAEAMFERSAILEFQAHCHPRALAESLALLDTVRRWPELLTGVSVFEVEVAGGTQWILSSGPEMHRNEFATMGAVVIAKRSVEEVLREQYGGVAVLTPLG